MLSRTPAGASPHGVLPAPPVEAEPEPPRLTAGEIFAGYGGLATGVEQAFAAAPGFPEADTTWVAENDDAPSRILAARFPGVPNHGDVTTLDWASVQPVDVLSGGSPCQSISGAGRRVGMIPGAASNLWIAQREAIARLRPRYAVWENVRGALTSKASCLADPDGKTGVLRAMGRVLGDLTTLGYDAEWRLIRASDVGICHQRARVFVIAWDRDQVIGEPPPGDPVASWDEASDLWREPSDGLFGGGDPYAAPFPICGAVRAGDFHARPPREPGFPEVPYLRTPTATVGAGGALSARRAAELGSEYRISSQIIDLMHPGFLDGEHDGPLVFKPPLKLLPTPAASRVNDGEDLSSWDARRARIKALGINGNGMGEPLTIAAQRLGENGAAALKLLPTPRTTDTNGPGRHGDGGLDLRTAVSVHLGQAQGLELFADADPATLTAWGEYLPAVLRHALVTAMDIPAPTEPGTKIGSRPRLHAPFVEWMMTLPPGWVTAPALELTRSQQLRALGNGVVPAQAAAALADMLACTTLARTV